jgi:hypothetical protein
MYQPFNESYANQCIECDAHSRSYPTCTSDRKKYVGLNVLNKRRVMARRLASCSQPLCPISPASSSSFCYCNAGYQFHSVSAFSCSICADGTYQSANCSTSNNCVQCTSGSDFSPQSCSYVQCFLPLAGHKCSPYSQAPCPAGTYQPYPGQTTCYACPGGSFSGPQSTICHGCAIGHAASGPGNVGHLCPNFGCACVWWLC